MPRDRLARLERGVRRTADYYRHIAFRQEEIYDLLSEEMEAIGLELGSTAVLVRYGQRLCARFGDDYFATQATLAKLTGLHIAICSTFVRFTSCKPFGEGYSSRSTI